MLADGILRSALHVAAERSAMDARYADAAPMDVLKKLDFNLIPAPPVMIIFSITMFEVASIKPTLSPKLWQIIITELRFKSFNKLITIFL